MPFAKSNGRGNLATRRPKEDNSMENWSEEQKMEYNRKKKQKERGPPASKRGRPSKSPQESRAPPTQDRRRRSQQESPASVGRPPIGESPMTPNTHKARKSKENEVQPFIDDADTGVTVTDGEDQEDGDADTDEMGMYCSAVVWAKYGKFWYPAKVVSLETVPTNFRKKLPSTENKYVISWFGESKFSAIA